jgi:hypothetical protein
MTENKPDPAPEKPSERAKLLLHNGYVLAPCSAPLRSFLDHEFSAPTTRNDIIFDCPKKQPEQAKSRVEIAVSFPKPINEWPCLLSSVSVENPMWQHELIYGRLG